MAETEFKYDVFLSHNGKDKPAVEHIARLLRDEYRLKAWLDKWNLIPGEAWQEGLENALDECQTFAVFLGPSGIGPWENEEMRSAIEERVRDSKRRVIPVLLPGAPDNKDLKLPRFLRRATWVDFRSGLDDKEALYRLYCGIKGQAPGDRSSSVSPKTPTSADWHLAHPYPMPPNFTGRRAERNMLTGWLNSDWDHPLLIIRALGGFGKSALVWHWLTHNVDAKQWPKVVFWSFYEGDASFDNFLKESLKYLGVLNAEQLNPHQQTAVLLNLLQNPGILLILDGFERVLRAYGNMGAAYQGDEVQKDKDDKQDTSRDCINIFADAFLRSIGAYGYMLRSKVLMTTRLTPHAVERFGQFLQGVREEELRAMHKDDAVEFFHTQGIRGTHGEIEAACEPYGFHPLSLRILSGWILNDRRQPGDIAAARSLEITKDIIQNKHHILEVGFSSLFPAQRKLLGRIACFRAAMTYDALKTLHGDGKGNVSFDESLKALESRGLLHWDRKTNKYDLHPIVRRYAYDRLTAADRTGAHERLANYFEAVPEPEKVQTLEDLAPVIELYHHMVRAGNLDEARKLFSERLSPNPLYFQFGAYQLIGELLRALFLDGEDKPPRLKDESAQAWTLNELANTYSLSGQPRRAVPPYTSAIELYDKAGLKKNLAISRCSRSSCILANRCNAECRV